MSYKDLIFLSLYQYSLGTAFGWVPRGNNRETQYPVTELTVLVGVSDKRMVVVNIGTWHHFHCHLHIYSTLNCRD